MCSVVLLHHQPNGALRTSGENRINLPMTPSSHSLESPAIRYDSDCVHEVPNGAHVDIHGLVRRLDGSSFQIPACSAPGRVRESGITTAKPTLNHWIEWADYSPGTYWGSINASWHVPPAPTGTYASNQAYFSFPGMQSSTFVIQPVLTYGYASNYGGNYWSAASWHCDTGAHCLHGTPISPLAAGDSVVGTVAASDCISGICTWTIVTIDVTKGVRSSFAVDDTTAYYDAVGGSVEVFNLTSCNEFPSTGILFSGIALYDQSNNQVTPSWNKNLQSPVSPSCGFNVDTTFASVNLLGDVGVAVSVSGPRSDTAYAYVTATANVSGGVAPYSYAWTVNDTTRCGNQTTCSWYIGAAGSFTSFDVTVTDAYQFTASGALSVNACPPPGGAPIRSTKQGPPPPLCGP